MPSVSKRQRDFMLAIAHNAAFAKKAGVKQSVGKDFSAADKARGHKALNRLPMRKSSKTAADGGP